MKTEGKLSDWFETGSEGSFWILEENGVAGMAGVHFIKKGDHLKIISVSGQIVFEGVIEPDSVVSDTAEIIYRNQPTSCGRWIHWYQKGFDPDLWGSYFFLKLIAGS